MTKHKDITYKGITFDLYGPYFNINSSDKPFNDRQLKDVRQQDEDKKHKNVSYQLGWGIDCKSGNQYYFSYDVSYFRYSVKPIFIEYLKEVFNEEEYD